MSESCNQPKIFLFAIVVLIMSFALTSCNTINTSVQSELSNDNFSLDKPVVLSMWSPPFSISFPPGIQDDPVMMEISKKTGVILDITPMNAISDYGNKLTASLATNDLPDITYVANSRIAPLIVSSKAALAMDNYLDTYGSHIINETPFRVEFSRKYLSVDTNGNTDNKLYYWMSGGDSASDPIQVQVAPYLRYDLWEKLGYPKLDSLDDYIPVLKEMMKLEPFNKDGKKNYGVSGWFADWGNWVFNSAWPMFEGKGGIGTHTTIDMVTQTIESKILNPHSPYWQGLEWFNKAYREGILDPEAPSMKWDDFLEKVSENRVFLGWAPWNIDGGNQTFVKDGTPEKGYYQMPPPHKLDRYMVSYEQPQGGNMFFISSKTAFPEKAVQLLDFLTSYEGTELIYNGVKGVHWDEVNNKPRLRPETIKGIYNDDDYSKNTGVMKYSNIAGRGYNAIDPKYNVSVYFYYLPEVLEERLTPLMKKGSKHFGVKFPGDLYLKNSNLKYTNWNLSLSSNLNSQPDVIKKIDANINHLINSKEISLILCKTEKDFNTKKNKLIEDCIKLNAEKSLKWAQDALVKLQSN